MKLAIFDLDGTLLNTIADLGAACNHALAAFGYPLHTPEDYPRLVGNGVNRLIERALPPEARSEAEVLRLREAFVPFYNAHNKVQTRPYEGIPELLAALKSRGWRLAVASNKYQAATADIVNHYFPHVFDVVLGEREGCPRKPDPHIVSDILTLIASSELSLPAQKPVTRAVTAVYIGDSDVDMLTAHNAALPAVACTWGFCSRSTLLQYSPWAVADHPGQLLHILSQTL